MKQADGMLCMRNAPRLTWHLLLFITCVYFGGGELHATVLCAGQRTPCSSGFSPYTMWLVGMNSHHHAWLPASSPTEPSQLPGITCFNPWSIAHSAILESTLTTFVTMGRDFIAWPTSCLFSASCSTKMSVWESRLHTPATVEPSVSVLSLQWNSSSLHLFPSEIW